MHISFIFQTALIDIDCSRSKRDRSQVLKKCHFPGAEKVSLGAIGNHDMLHSRYVLDSDAQQSTL